jgi:hypothetical protein
MTKLASSPDRGTFQFNSLKRKLEAGETTAEHVAEMTEYYQSWHDNKRSQEQQAEWQQNNLEHDLRSCEWICAKVRHSEVYAQNLYAAMCNRDFQKIDVWPMLKGETWSCSWRYAGGIVADMCGKGDYMDYYCSGIRGGAVVDDDEQLTDEQRARIEYYDIHYVSESVVTDEIREDLRQLGWSVLDEDR